MHSELNEALGRDIYEVPHFDCCSLASVVMSGPTGGFDSGFTGLGDEGPNSDEEDDYYFG